MVRQNNGEYARHERARRQLQLLYARETCERQIFIEDLKEFRKRKFKYLFKSIITEVGPKWYQALSLKQLTQLDKLETALRQDIMSGLPARTAQILNKLGLIPPPTYPELMSCITLGCLDPKELLAQLYYGTYGFNISGKCASYCLHARLILSSIFYLGYDNLIVLLEKTFAPDRSTSMSESKPKPEPPPKLLSPYHAKLVAALYVPPKPRRPPPPPLPDLAALHKPYEELPVLRKPPPPPPPPPPPKKRIPISHCQKLADMYPITAHVSPIELPAEKKPRSKLKPKQETPKKKYGINIELPKKKTSKKKRVPPLTGLWNEQYTINGVFIVHGRACYVLGNVSILPSLGEMIHGGHALVGGMYVNIHCGHRGWLPEKKPDPCDCLQQWETTVFDYIENTKCKCGHHFDFKNEGTFSQEELPFFTKPTRHTPMQFHHETIFDTDVDRQFIKKEFKKIWESDSLLRTDEDTKRLEKKRKKKKLEKEREKAEKMKADKEKAERDRLGRESKKAIGDKSQTMVDKAQTMGDKPQAMGDKAQVMVDKAQALGDKAQAKHQGSKAIKELKPAKSQIFGVTSQSCLGPRPKITDYLKCALQLMRQVNVAARLPDLHLVPELIEWMRYRLHGRHPLSERKEYLRKSNAYWAMFKRLGDQSFGHVSPPDEPLYGRATTWLDKQKLQDNFRLYTERYKLQIFKSHAYISNLYWRTMYQAEFPDKNFREIFFSYLYSKVEDIQLIHPYSRQETMAKRTVLMDKRYVCLPPRYQKKT